MLLKLICTDKRYHTGFGLLRFIDKTRLAERRRVCRRTQHTNSVCKNHIYIFCVFIQHHGIQYMYRQHPVDAGFHIPHNVKISASVNNCNLQKAYIEKIYRVVCYKKKTTKTTSYIDHHQTCCNHCGLLSRHLTQLMFPVYFPNKNNKLDLPHSSHIINNIFFFFFVHATCSPPAIPPNGVWYIFKIYIYIVLTRKHSTHYTSPEKIHIYRMIRIQQQIKKSRVCLFV